MVIVLRGFVDWILLTIIFIIPLMVLVGVMFSGLCSVKKKPPLRFSEFTETTKTESKKHKGED